MKFIKKLFIAIKILLDNKVPIGNKMWILLPVLYLLSPIDLIPDYPVLGFGFIDDIVLIYFFINKIQSILKNYVDKKTKKTEEIKGKIIEDVEYKIEDDHK